MENIQTVMPKRTCFILILYLCNSALNFLYAQGSVVEIADKARTITSITDSVVDSKWIYGGRFQLSLNQFYSNNSKPYIGLSTLDRVYVYYRTNKFSWENTLDIDFGMRYTFHKDSTKKYEKTSDKIELNSQFAFRAKGDWHYSGLLNIYTQLANGWDISNTTRISSFMTPGYITLSIGMYYKRKKWSLYISPVAAKLVTKLDDRFYSERAFGVDTNKKSHLSIGTFIRLNFDADIHPKVHLNTKLELFYDYLGEYTQMRNMMTNFEMTWRFSITEWLFVSLKTTLFYDYNVRFPVYEQDGVTVMNGITTDHLQFQETFGLTLGYKFRFSRK
jgi:hypothetical protein